MFSVHLDLGLAPGDSYLLRYNYNVAGTLINKEDNYFNYGQGIKIDLGMQYFMMDNIAMQISMGYSGKVPGLETKNSLDLGAGLVRDSTTKYKANVFGIKALVVPRFEILELLNMYTGVGLGFFWNSLKFEANTEAGPLSVHEEGKIKSSPALALLGLIGADIPLSDLMSAYGEVAFEQMSFKWKKKVVENGGTFVYEKDAPNQESPPRIPGSNWQIRVGVRFVVL